MSAIVNSVDNKMPVGAVSPTREELVRKLRALIARLRYERLPKWMRYRVATINIGAAVNSGLVLEFKSSRGGPTSGFQNGMSACALYALMALCDIPDEAALKKRVSAFKKHNPQPVLKDGNPVLKDGVPLQETAFERKDNTVLSAFDPALYFAWFILKEQQRYVNHKVRVRLSVTDGPVSMEQVVAIMTAENPESAFRAAWNTVWSQAETPDIPDYEIPTYGIAKIDSAGLAAIRAFDYRNMCALYAMMLIGNECERTTRETPTLAEQIVDRFIADNGSMPASYAEYSAIMNSAVKYGRQAKANLVGKLLSTQCPAALTIQEADAEFCKLLVPIASELGYNIHSTERQVIDKKTGAPKMEMNPTLILTRTDISGTFEVIQDELNPNNETIIVKNDDAKLIVVGAHLTSSGPKTVQWEETKVLLNRLASANPDYVIVLGIDANQDIRKSMDGLAAEVSITGSTVDKERSALQAQLDKVNVYKEEIIDFIVVVYRGRAVVMSSLLWKNDLPDGTLSPNPEYPTDHFTVVADFCLVSETDDELASLVAELELAALELAAAPGAGAGGEETSA